MRGVWLHASLGASPFPDAAARDTHAYEIFIGITRDLVGVDRRLASLAGYRHGTGIKLSPGFAVPSDLPLWDGTDMRALLIMQSRVPIIPDLVLDDSRHADFLQAIPLHANELDYRMRVGANELIDQFEQLEGAVLGWNASAVRTRLALTRNRWHEKENLGCPRCDQNGCLDG
jgi:hypothetical protein